MGVVIQKKNRYLYIFKKLKARDVFPIKESNINAVYLYCLYGEIYFMKDNVQELLKPNH